jgi:hypothetical protein
LDDSPFKTLFFFPKKFFTLPMRSPIAPEEKIDIETVPNETFEIVDHKTHNFARDRKTKVAITLKLDMETSS